MAAGGGYEIGPGGGMEFNAMAQGPRRYGIQRSTTATSGPVDNQGYQERELRRRARQAAIQGRIGATATPAVPKQVLDGMGQWQR